MRSPEGAREPADRPTFLDATLFLGMHDGDQARRARSLAFFTRRLGEQVFMSLEQVGLCDHVIWARGREEQDAYYPFMDNLHTLMAIRRRGYDRADMALALGDARLARLPFRQACTLAQVMSHDGILHTHDPALLGRDELRHWLADDADEAPLAFPEPLQALYEQSRRLVLALEDGCYA